MADVSRRRFLIGIGIAVAAPAIVHAGNLMPVKAWDTETLTEIEADLLPTHPELVAVMRRAFVPRLYVQLWRGEDWTRAVQAIAA